MKICKKCRKEKDESEFHIHKQHGLNSYCKICHKRSCWENDLHRYYNLTVKQYEMMLKSQNGVCAICNKPEIKENKNGTIKRLGVDHCHKTREIRGLLCDKCNRGLGYYNDDPELLEKAALYLKGKLCARKKLN